MREDIATRIAAKIVVDGNGCHVWQGVRDRRGYAYMSVDGRNRRLSRYVSHAPRDKVACHSCDNPSCVNPSHIFLGTQKDNLQDMASKGRHRNQSKTHCPKGHPYIPERTRIDGKGARQCKECDRVRSAKKRADAKLRSETHDWPEP